MAVHSTPFGPTILAGADAEAFRRHIAQTITNERAIATARRGSEMARVFRERGYVDIAGPVEVEG